MRPYPKKGGPGGDRQVGCWSRDDSQIDSHSYTYSRSS